MSDETADILAEVTLDSLIQVKAWLRQLEGETTRDHACIAAMREQLALRDARIAALEEAIRHVLAREAVRQGQVELELEALGLEARDDV